MKNFTGLIVNTNLQKTIYIHEYEDRVREERDK